MNPRIIAAQCVRFVAFFVFIGVVLAAVLSAAPLEARELTDIFGRKVVVPNYINRAYATSPPATYML
ncbi:MAG: hypothetical protein ABFD62_04630, partial [Syntrophaceae bacterium]